MSGGDATRAGNAGSGYNRACFSNSAVIKSKYPPYGKQLDTLLRSDQG